jgi:hypothetical protein
VCGVSRGAAGAYVAIEAVLRSGGDRPVIVDDTNSGSTVRNPAFPDGSDLNVVKVPHVKAE